MVVCIVSDKAEPRSPQWAPRRFTPQELTTRQSASTPATSAPTLPVRWVRIFCHACADGWFSEMEPIEYSWRFSLSCLRRYLLKRSKKNKVSERRSMLRNFLPSWFYICGVSLIVPKSQFPHLLNGVNYFCPICIIEKLWKCEGIIEWYGFENQFMS